MKIFHPEDLFKILQNKHLLLDTNVFIDSFNFSNPEVYSEFFNELKDNDTTLVTIDGVIHEFLKGSKNQERYDHKKEYIEKIIDLKLSFREDSEHISHLIRLYEVEGGNVPIVDYYLGANLLKYKSNLFLMTRDLKDFPQKIFKVMATISIPADKTIFTYGIYTYEPKRVDVSSGLDDVPF